MYFIWGENQYLIDFNEKQIIEKIAITPIVFNNLSNFSDIVTEIETVSLFEEKKLIIIHNSPLLTMKDLVIAEKLFNTIKKCKNQVTLVLTLNHPRLLMSNELIKFLLKNSEIIEAKKIKEKDVIPIIKNIVATRKGTITNKAALKLAIILPDDLLIINNEINKLLLETNEIDEKTIDISVAQYDRHSVFALSNAIVSGNSSEIVKTYYEEINNGVDPVLIIAQLASNYELAYLIGLYKKEGYSIDKISHTLSIHAFRIRKINQILEQEFTYSISWIIKQLSQLDYDIKIGKIKKAQGLDKFILNIIKN